MDYARLLPWLAWTLLTYTCVDIAGKRSRSPFRPADAAITEAAAGTASEWIEPAVQEYIDDLVYQGTKAPQVLMVLDPNGVICWENVEIDDFTNATLLPWLHSQHDALSLSNQDRSGRTLQVRSRLLYMGTLHVCAQFMLPVGITISAAGQSSAAAAVLSNSNDSCVKDAALVLGQLQDAPSLAVWKCSCHI